MRTPSFIYSVFFSGFFSLLLPVFYILRTDFPISHEAPQYILRAKDFIHLLPSDPYLAFYGLFKYSHYPIPILLLATFRTFTSLAWPTIVYVTTIASHFFAGLVLARWAYRVKNQAAAIIALFFWPLTFTFSQGLLNGWLAHQLSIPLSLLCLYLLSQSRYRHALITGIITFFTHPFAAFFVGLVTLVSIVPRFIHPISKLRILILITVATAVISGLIIWLNYNHYDSTIITTKTVFSILKPFSLPFTIPFLVSLYGLVAISSRLTSQSHFPQTWTTYVFYSFSAVLTFNHAWLGVSVLELRFEPFFWAAVVLLASTGLVTVSDKITPIPTYKLAIIGWTIVPIIYLSLKSQLAFYRQYNNNPDLVPTPNERTAIDWINNNLSPDSHIVSQDLMPYKWIPISSNRTWSGLQENWETYTTIFNLTTPALSSPFPYTHLVIFKIREPELKQLMFKYRNKPTIFENQDTVIKQLII